MSPKYNFCPYCGSALNHGTCIFCRKYPEPKPKTEPEPTLPGLPQV